MKTYRLGEQSRFVPEKIVGTVLAIVIGVTLGLALGVWFVENHMIEEKTPQTASVKTTEPICTAEQSIEVRLACEALEVVNSRTVE